jgi:hypothetical protein
MREIKYILLIAAFIFIVGCENPRDALNGYTMHEADTYYIDHPLNKAILNDVDDFIRSEKIPPADISERIYGEDKDGRHVACLLQEIPKSQGMEAYDYILYYDQNNVRTNVKKFRIRRSC